MNIWLITVGEPLPGYSVDDRLWRSGYLSRLLAARGHQVTWWVSSFDHFRKKQLVETSKRFEVEPCLTLQFLRGREYRRNVSFSRLVNHWQIAREFRSVSRAYPQPAIILCSFPTIELSREAVRYGREFGIPVVLDIRDLWPDEMLWRLPKAAQRVGRILLQPLYASARRAMRGASALVAISESFLVWGLELSGRARRPGDAVFPMGYTGTLDASGVSAAEREQILAKGIDPKKRIFWFAGTFVGNIDLGTVIEAARELQDDDDIQFVLTGSGERDQEWRAQAQGLSNVIFSGWAGSGKLAYLASIAWAGLGSYRKGARMSLPNKLFEYMSAGLPVILSLEGDTRELVLGKQIGLAYEAEDVASLVTVVRRLASNAADRNRLSVNARQVYLDRFSPSSIYNQFADYLAAVAGRRSPQSIE